MKDRELQARKRIERELHDGLQQDLVAIVVKLQLARRLADTDPPAATALLEEIRAEAQAALDATRDLALRIYPPTLDGPGLRAALRAVAGRTLVDVSLGPRWPEELVACAYICCLELLPAASAIEVYEEGGAVVFDVVTADPPSDLSRLEGRVEALGGSLTREAGRVTGVLPARPS